MDQQFVVYGIDFDRSKFETIKNDPEYAAKPHGGLWSSPVISDHSWYDWCKGEDFRTESLNKSFQFKLTKSARVLYINSYRTLLTLPLTFSKYFIDLLERKIDTSASSMPLTFAEYDELIASLNDPATAAETFWKCVESGRVSLGPTGIPLDFEKLAKEYDALFLDFSNEVDNEDWTLGGNNLRTYMYFYDVDTLLVFNPDILVL